MNKLTDGLTNLIFFIFFALVTSLSVSSYQYSDAQTNKTHSQVSCPNNLPITGVSSSPSQNNFPPTKAVDNDTNSKWWSTNSLNPSIRLDLASTRTVCAVGIAFADGNLHPYKFVISTSNDGTKFVDTVAGISNGTTTAAEKYVFPPVHAKFVKITVTQHTRSD